MDVLLHRRGERSLHDGGQEDPVLDPDSVTDPCISLDPSLDPVQDMLQRRLWMEVRRSFGPEMLPAHGSKSCTLQ